MDFTLHTPPAPAGSAIEALRAEGMSYEDIRMALDLQTAQRHAGVPVLPLRAICGLERPQRRNARAVFDTTRALLGTPPPRRGKGSLHITRNPVWADSVQTGSDDEADFARPLARRSRARLVIAGKRVLKLGRKLACEARAGERILSDCEKKCVCFTASCQQILVELLNNEEYRKGWCIPAYETIAAWTGLSRSTVYRSLRTLADLGVVEWIRRFVYSRDEELGARSAQTSNLYRFTLPTWLSTLIGLEPPLPVDEADRREHAAEDHAAMLAGTARAERRRLMPDDPALRAALVAAAHRRDRRVRADLVSRECHDDLPPLHKDSIIKNETTESAWTADAFRPDGLRPI